MSVRTTRTERSQSKNNEELRKAEERAENAERRVEQLESQLKANEHSHSAQKSGDNARVSMTPVDPELEATKEAVLSDLRNEPMMDHLLKALEAGQDIGHYGRLVFAMVAHHFLPEEAVIGWLNRDPGTNPEEAVALLRQVETRDYNPPRRERILAWQAQQEFPILPNPDDPDCGNVYRNLKFPQKVYEHIQEYQEEKIHSNPDCVYIRCRRREFCAVTASCSWNPRLPCCTTCRRTQSPGLEAKNLQEECEGFAQNRRIHNLYEN